MFIKCSQLTFKYFIMKLKQTLKMFRYFENMPSILYKMGKSYYFYKINLKKIKIDKIIHLNFKRL